MGQSVKLRVVSDDDRAKGFKKGKEKPISDADLVHRVREGDKSAENILSRRYVREVGRMVSRLLGSYQDVDDVVQDTFLIAFESIDKLREPSVFRGWILRIAINRSRRVIRKKRFLRTFGLDASVPDATLEELAQDRVSQKFRDELIALDQVLARLPTEQRIAWTLKNIEGHTIRDVSRLCQCSLSTIKRRLAHADKRISRSVDEEVLWNESSTF